jgi:hypothetical protein
MKRNADNLRMPDRRKRLLLFSVLVCCAIAVGTGLFFWLGPNPNGPAKAVSAIADGAAQPLFGEPGAEIKVEQIETAPSVSSFKAPESMPVYTIASTEKLTREAMDELASTLGMGPKRDYQEKGLNDSQLALSFPRSDDSGCFCFSDMNTLDEVARQFEGGQSISLPSEEEARRIADDSLVSLGLLDGLTFYDVSVCDRITRSQLGQPDRSSPLSIGVWYEASISGFPLVGPGAKVDVVVGPGGKVLEIRHYAQKATKSEREVQLRSISDALEDLKSGMGQPPVEATVENAKQVTVEKAQLGYYAAPVPAGVLDYVPVYLLAVRLSDGSLGEWVVSAYSDGSLMVAH